MSKSYRPQKGSDTPHPESKKHLLEIQNNNNNNNNNNKIMI
jgi:hypothetical protein